MVGDKKKWDIVEGTVFQVVSYGLRVRLADGEIGVVDRMLLSDLPLKNSEWPKVNDKLTVVCGGYTSGGQLRLSLRDSDLDLAAAKRLESSGTPDPS